MHLNIATQDSGFEDCTDCCDAAAGEPRPDPHAIDAVGRSIFYSALGGLFRLTLY